MTALYQRFGAKSPQFADVGRAMKEWMDRGRHAEFSYEELQFYSQWCWHELGAMTLELEIAKRENSKLNRENEELKQSNRGNNDGKGRQGYADGG